MQSESCMEWDGMPFRSMRAWNVTFLLICCKGESDKKKGTFSPLAKDVCSTNKFPKRERKKKWARLRSKEFEKESDKKKA